MNDNNLELYSRQIYTYGEETMKQIMNLKVLIFGLRGLGLESAKNLILSGIQEICIYDDNICRINDLTSNFYIEDKDINRKRRDEACLQKLSNLNPYVKVSINNNKNIFQAILNYNMVIITEIMKTEILFKINETCRKNNIGFIYSGNFGLTGFLFLDFGPNHIIIDENGEENASYFIKLIIKKESTYEIYIENREEKPFNLKDGSFVIFREIKGLEGLNDGIPRKIKIISKNCVSIKNDKNFIGDYISGGIIEEIKIPKEIKFNPLKDKFYIPYFNESPIIFDQSKLNDNELLHCGIVALHEYYDKNNDLPELNNLEEAKDVIGLAKKFYDDSVSKNYDWLKSKNKKSKLKYIEFKEDYLIKMFRWSKSEINPICSFLGGIISQETLKITGKYNPIYQWIKFDFFETVADLSDNCDRSLSNTRYDDQIAIFGNDVQNKLSNLNIFMIGAGALGCEYLKNFALMGISTVENCKVTVTDNDNIELSNLSRQFLFRSSDIGQSKSNCACRESKKINENFNCVPLNEILNDKTTNIFDDYFWENQNLIFSAVDNIKAREFIGKKIVLYSKPLIDSGTNGTNASCDIYFPGKTICFDDIPAEIEYEIPMCTLKSFPSQIEHCIEWSKMKFEELFHQIIIDLKMLINDTNNFFEIINKEPNENEIFFKLEKLKYLLEILINKNKEKIISFCYYLFEEFFSLVIGLLIENHPINEIDENGNLFWSGSRRIPKKIGFNIEDLNIFLFFKSVYFLLIKIIDSNESITDETIKYICNKECRNEIKINKININEFKSKIVSLVDEKLKLKIEALKPEIFDKNNNIHINFILASSNLRAKNYNIKECNFLKAKEISGEIIPSISSSTASITGLASLQIYSLVQSSNIENMRCYAFNLATSIYEFSVPEEVRYICEEKDYKAIPTKFTIWDSIEILGPLIKIEDIVNYYKNKYNVDIDYINCGNKTLACPFENKDDNQTTIEYLYEKVNQTKISNRLKFIPLSFSGSFGNIECKFPNIKYFLKTEKRFIFNKKK